MVTHKQQKLDEDSNEKFWVCNAMFQVGNFDSSDQLAKLPIEQDYDDIDYTSGGLVTFHTSLSKKWRKGEMQQIINPKDGKCMTTWTTTLLEDLLPSIVSLNEENESIGYQT